MDYGQKIMKKCKKKVLIKNTNDSYVNLLIWEKRIKKMDYISNKKIIYN